MIETPTAHGERDRLTSCFRQGDVIRSRGVSGVVLSGAVDIPAPPARLLADWDRDIASLLGLEPGDVEPLSLSRARTRWPDYRRCVEAMSGWMRTFGLDEALSAGDVSLMACRGAAYHHDALQYGDSVFCNLFLSEDKGLDVHFPGTGDRIPLVRGTTLIFDTGQPHAVIRRDRQGFDAADFAAGRDCTQVFLSWELPIDDPAVAQALGIVVDADADAPAAHAQQELREQLRLNGVPVEVCARTGCWRRAG